jgi:capsular exopolysaccharide synthesis family protein
MDSERTNLSLERVMGVLRRRGPWVVACLLLVAGTAYGFSRHQTKQYTATALLVFSSNQPSQQVAGLQAPASNETQQARENTNVKLVQVGDLAARTAGQLGQGLTKNKVKDDVDVRGQSESNFVEVAATATSPKLAAAIANTYSKVFLSEQQSYNEYGAILSTVRKRLAALPGPERAGPAGRALRDVAQKLRLIAELPPGTARVAAPATEPTSPSSPKTVRNTVLGGVLGLLLGLGIAFLLERFDRRIREPRDLEGIYGLPLLGVVPESSALARPGRRKARRRGGPLEALPPSEAEVFQLVRAHLRYFNVDREMRTLLVASAAPGDGKTTIALHLAAAAARVGSIVLLVEADLRHPTVAQQLDVGPGPGLSDVLIGSLSLWKATQSIDLDHRSGVWAQGPALDVLVAGAPLPPNPAELIESRAMEAMLQEASSTYDLVVIDTPPLVAVSDAFPLLGKVDGAIIVGRVGRNRRDVAERLHETLAGARAPLLGVVANGVKAGRGSYAYGYGYDYTRNGATPAAGGVSSNGASSSRRRARTTRN